MSTWGEISRVFLGRRSPVKNMKDLNSRIPPEIGRYVTNLKVAD